jgi:hypothetical protein
MAEIFIPSIGDKLKLTDDWQFPCFVERRNAKLITALRPDVKLSQTGHGVDMQTVMLTIPKDAVLRVDRIYIRKGKKEWDSITFVITRHPSIPSKGFSGVGRFWAKLVDVNGIKFEHYEDDTPKPTKAKKR